MKNNLAKRVTSFLLASALSFSTFVANAETVFADSGGKAIATILNDTEHGILTFAENNFENVYMDIPIESDVGYSFNVDENGEVNVSEESIDTENSSTKTEFTQVVNPNAKRIDKNEKVIINTEPDEGYSVETIYVIADSGKSISYNFNDNQISFNMPSEDITIRATFSNTIADVVKADVDSYAMYIQSNINEEYAHKNTLKLVNAIRVKQTIVDGSIFNEHNTEPTIDNLFSTAADGFDLSDALLNFSFIEMPVYDVDANSEYYVAFVDTMHNDTSEIRDICVANNNPYAELIDSNSYYYDNATGILYIKKSVMKDISNSEEITENDFNSIQIQLLNVFNNADEGIHQVSIINNITGESGNVNYNMYDDTISIKVDNINEAEIKVNNIIINVDNNDFIYDEDSHILNIITPVWNVNSVEINPKKNNTDDTVNDTIANAAFYSNWAERGPTIRLSSTAKTGISGNVSVTRYTNGDRFYEPDDGYAAYGVPDTYEDELIYDIANGTNNTPNNITPISDTSKYYYTHQIDLSDLEEVTINGCKWNFTDTKNKIKKILLECAHVSSPLDNDKLVNDGDSYNVKIRVFEINANTVVWGIITNRSFDQTGVGIFKSPYIDENGSFTFKKTFYNDGYFKWSNVYSKVGCAYTLVKNDNKKEYATFEITSINGKGNPVWTVNTKNGATHNELTVENLPVGTYTLTETKSAAGTDKAPAITNIEIKSGKTTTIAGGSSKDYVQLLKFNAHKYDTSTASNGSIAGAKFNLYYSQYPITINSINITNTVDTVTAISATNSKNYGIGTNTTNNIVAIATYTTDSAGKMIPTITTNLYTSADGEMESPHKSGEILDNLPLGYYLLVETAAPAGYSLDLSNNKPILYYLDAHTVDAKNASSFIQRNTANDSNVTKYKVTYNGSNYVTSKYTDYNDYTFKIDNTTLGYSAKKFYSHDYNPASENYIKDWTSFYNAFLKDGTSVAYSLISATYQLSLKRPSSSSYVIAATGTTTKDGTIQWTLSKFGKSNKLFLSADSSKIYGFKKGYKIQLKETASSRGTVRDITVQNSTFGDSDISHTTNTAETKARLNSVMPANLGVRKRVQITDGNILHKGTSFTYYDKTESIAKTVTVEDETMTMSSDILDNVYGDYILLDFTNCSDIDKINYFAGTSFDIWYNPKELSSNASKFPTYTISHDGKSAYMTSPNNNAVKVATVTYEKVNGTVKETMKALVFNVNNTNYTGIVKTSSINEVPYLTQMPIGAYAIVETHAANATTETNIKIIHVAKYEYITDSGYKTYYYANYTEEKPTIASVTLRKYQASTIQTKIAPNLDGALYDVYFMSSDDAEEYNLTNINTNNLSSLSDEEYNNVMNSISTHIGSFNGNTFSPKDVYRVGGFRICNVESGTLHNVGAVTCNLFTRMYSQNQLIYDVDSKYYQSDNLPEDLKNARKYLLEKDLISDEKSGIGKYNYNATVTSPFMLNLYKSAVINSSSFTTFHGPKGLYVVVERKAPNSGSYGIDKTIHVSYIDDSNNFAIKSYEPRQTDQLDINIEKKDVDKISEQDNSKYDLGGTIFTAKYYDAADFSGMFSLSYNEFVEKFENDEDDDIDSSTFTAHFEVNSKDSTRPGTKNSLTLKNILDMTEYKEYNSYRIFKKNYPEIANYVNSDYKLLLPSGIFIIKETTPADGFVISEDDNFYDPDGADCGKYLIFKLTEDINGNISIAYLAKHNITHANIWKKYTNSNDLTTTATFSIGNNAEPFNLQVFKRLSSLEYDDEDDSFNINYSIPSEAKFKLTKYDQTGTTKLKSWKFTVKNGTYNSVNDTVFSDVDNKPMIPTYQYVLEEIDNNDVYIVKSDKFVYEKGMSISSIIQLSSKYTQTPIYHNNVIYNYSEPAIRTDAWTGSAENKVKYADPTSKTATKITDTVHLYNIAQGNTYIIRGIAVDVTDPNNPQYLKDNNGKYITAYAMFSVPYASRWGVNKNIDIEYNIPAGLSLDGKTINFYEYLGYVGPIIEDGVIYSVYDYDGYVDGKVTTSNYNLTVTNGKLNLSNIGLIKTPKGKYVSHANPKDERQNIHFPSVATLESDKYTKSHLSGIHNIYYTSNDKYENVSYILDKVTINNLPVGKFYLITSINDISSGDVITSAKKSFTSNGNASQTINVGPLAADTDNVSKIYISEKLYDSNNKLIYTHDDKNDTKQQGYVPSIGTSASSGKHNTKLVLAESNATVVDIVNYKNLADLNHSYFVQGYLVDKSNNKIIAMANKSFTNTNKDDSIQITFNFNSSNLDGRTLVVYEYLYYSNATTTLKVGNTFIDDTIMKADANPKHDNYGKLLAKHVDANDTNQIVYIPKVSTNAVATTNASVKNNKLIVPKGKATEITDTVNYENVIAGETYSIYGFFVDLTNNKIVAKANTSFKATKTKDTAKVKFSFDASKYVGHSIVVYEYMYWGNQTSIGQTLTVGSTFNESKVESSTNTGYLIGKHVDSTDKNQTVKVLPRVNFTKIDSDTGKSLAGAEYRIINVDKTTTVDSWTSTTETHSVALDEGHYILEELSAPDGHALNDPIEFNVTINGDTIKVVYTISGEEPSYTAKTITYSNGTTERYKQYEIKSTDVKLSKLPTAGGLGTNPFTYIGILMFAGAIFIMYRKKRDTNV